MSESGNKVCPFCGEEIKAVAVKCRYCQSFLDNAEEAPGKPVKSYTEKAKSGKWLSVIAIILIIVVAILAYNLLSGSSDTQSGAGTTYISDNQENTVTQAPEQPEETPTENPAQISEAAAENPPETETTAENPPETETADSQTNISKIIGLFKPTEIPVSALIDLADSEPESNIEIVLAEPLGNTLGNIINAGYAATKDNWIYYSNLSEGGKLYKVKTDGTGRVGLNSDNSMYINVVGDWIYYSNFDDGKKIYKVKTDGSGRQRINSNPSEFLNVAGGWIYYMNIADGKKIYKIRTDGSEHTKINNSFSAYLNVVGDWIYYENVDDNNRIYKIRTDGSQQTRLKVIYAVESLNVSGDWIYFIVRDNRLIFKTDINEMGFTRVNDDSTKALNVVGDWIYYVNEDDGDCIYKIRTNGTERQKVGGSTNGADMLNVIGNWIYYRQNNQLKRVNISDDWKNEVVN